MTISNMDIYETRRRNLQYLADDKFPGHGQKTHLANMMGWKQPRASALLREKNPKNIGGTAARLIEQAFRMPRGWLDEQHYGLWEGTVGSLNDYMTPAYTTSATDLQTQTLPLLTDEEAGRWMAGERFTPASMMRFPLMPMMQVSEQAFVLEETTSSMPPQKPGDFYYIDPNTAPESNDWAAVALRGRVIVGIYERGRITDRISFTDGKESAVELPEDAQVCKVITRMDGAFARAFGGKQA